MLSCEEVAVVILGARMRKMHRGDSTVPTNDQYDDMLRGSEARIYWGRVWDAMYFNHKPENFGPLGD